MTVSEASSGQGNPSKEPVKFPGFPELSGNEAENRMIPSAKSRIAQQKSAVVTPLAKRKQMKTIEAPKNDDLPQDYKKPVKVRKKRASWTLVSFFLLVVLPGIFAGIYFTVIASPQYVVESQFSVRGSNGGGLSAMGFVGLLGNSVQSGDSYIVLNYVQSPQLIRDVKDDLGIDLRQYFSRPDIDFHNRIAADMPLEEFAQYWKNRLEVSYNSTTGNTTILIYAFSPQDAKTIADAVLKVSEHLVNTLSEKSRQQMTIVASRQVEKSEERLKKVREEIGQLRASEKTLDPQEIVKGEISLKQDLKKALTENKTKLNTLLQAVSPDAPNAKALKRQIKALEEQLKTQESAMDSEPALGDSAATELKSNVPEVLTRFEELSVEHEFATKAYTTALTALEAALLEAQKQERYFAVFVTPIAPEVSTYPLRYMDTGITLIVLLSLWLLVQFIYRSFRDHAL